MNIEFTDRYDALGIPYPDPETMCKGDCEGVGYYPIKMQIRPPKKGELCIDTDGLSAYEIREWQKQHNKTCNSFSWRLKQLFTRNWKDAFKSCDGWHFITCPDCKGTGKAVRNEM